MENRKIKVLVVDDSLVFREIMSRGISADTGIEVVAKAIDPFDARDKILKYHPDVMTCDVEMPKMNGIEFIRRLLPQYPLPIIVVSTVSNAVFDAMNAGAVDFVTKPDVQSPKSMEAFMSDLTLKIRIAAHARVNKISNPRENPIFAASRTETGKIIAMGASTGGTEALYNILKCVPSNIPGIVVVQHIPPVFSRMFAERLNNQLPLQIKEAETGDWVENGRVYIAPGDRHMRVKKIGERFRIEVFEGDKVNGHCPSVDILFEAVAKEAGKDGVGIILTGMGYDGARGLLSMRRKGARTIGQDEQSCVVYGMPRAAYETGAVEKQASLEHIPQALLTMLR
jgi:two-component system chemotaxis response regulator CheB